MPVLIKAEPKGTKRKPIQGIILLGLGYSWMDVKKLLGTSSSRISAWMKDPDLLAILEAVKALPLENHAKTPAVKSDDYPKNSDSVTPDLKTLASKTLQAVSRGLDSEDPRTALQAASLFLQNYVGGDTL